MPVVYAPKGGLRAIRAMLPKTVRAALYVYSRNNEDFMRVRPRMTHIWLHHGDTYFPEPDSPPAALLTSSSGTCRRSTMRSTPCWVTTRWHLAESSVASTTWEVMKMENRLAPLSGTCNR
jgi:hypothetical protein